MAYYLIYVSTAAHLMITDELHGLLAECRPLNTAADVTGALLYREGTFMQVLEGDRAAVHAVYDRIRADPRHYDVTMIIDGQLPHRQFSDWSMAFRDLGADQGEVAEGFSRFMMHGPGSETFGPDPTVAQRVLLTFRRSLTTAG